MVVWVFTILLPLRNFSVIGEDAFSGILIGTKLLWLIEDSASGGALNKSEMCTTFGIIYSVSSDFNVRDLLNL